MFYRLMLQSVPGGQRGKCDALAIEGAKQKLRFADIIPCEYYGYVNKMGLRRKLSFYTIIQVSICF